MSSLAPASSRPHVLRTLKDLRLFDGLAPFFLDHPDGSINWSKIPFAHLERNGTLDTGRVAAILAAFDHHVAAMAGLGYNAVMVDDLAHLTCLPFYPPALRAKLDAYRDLYRQVFAIAARHDLKVFVSSDALFVNPAIERHLREHAVSDSEFLRQVIAVALDAWPALEGVVLRIGESDGVDHRGDFTSRLSLRTADETRLLLRAVLPEFEGRGRTLIFRTWTLGAYPVGDLIWNRRTWDAVFAGIHSDSLIVSLKYGDADFFRYLDLNPLFFHGPQPRIVEVQCRREYEGMGEYPAFVGHMHRRHLARLRAGGCNLVGMFALQGGGWAPFRKTAFCPSASIWNELNAEVTVRLYDDEPLEQIIDDFCRRHGIGEPAGFGRLLELADAAVETGLYIREMASQPLYFRRVRIPPLTWVFWNTVTTGGLVAALARVLVRDPAAAIEEGYRAVETVEEMLTLAEHLGVPSEGIRFQLATFRLLALAREILLGREGPQTRQMLQEGLLEYRRMYPHGYHVEVLPAGDRSGSVPLSRFLPQLLRRGAEYRWRDRILLGRSASSLQRYVARRQLASLPNYVDTVGMPIEVLLR